MPKYILDATGNLILKQGLRYTTLADDAEMVLQTNGKTGYGFAIAGDNDEYVKFVFKTDGTVTLVYNSANVVNTDTDTKFCIYNKSGNVAIKNRLGSEKAIRYEVDWL